MYAIRSYYENMGLDVYGFIPPRNIVTDESFILIQENYEWTEFFSPITYRPKYVSPEVLEYSKDTYGLYHLPAWGVGNGDTLNNFDDVKTQIDYAIANKYWIAFNFHHIVDGSGTYDIVITSYSIHYTKLYDLPYPWLLKTIFWPTSYLLAIICLHNKSHPCGS